MKKLVEKYPRSCYRQSKSFKRIILFLHLTYNSLNCSTEGFVVDREQLDFQFDKSLAVIKSFERDWSQINQLCQQIGNTKVN